MDWWTLWTRTAIDLAVPPPTVTLVHRTSKKRGSGEAPVWVRVTHARRSKFFTGTGVEVKPTDWNDKRKRVRASHPLADALNAKLDDLYAKAKRAALDTSDAAEVLAALEGRGRGSLSDFLDRYIDRLREAGRTWERKKFETLKRKLTGALGWPLTWSQLSPDGLAAFEAHLRTEAENGPNTVRKELSRLRRVARLAIREGALEAGADPFSRYKLPKSAPVDRRRLSPEEVGRLLALGPEEGVGVGSRLAAVRDLFALQFYSAGARVSDALQFTPDNVAGGRITYVMQKTGTPHSVKIPPPARPVVDRLVAAVEGRGETARQRFGRYLVPLLKPGDDADGDGLRRRINSASVIANKALKELAKRAEVDPTGLSSHVARHTFADIARRYGNVYDLSKALGHTNLTTTQRYVASFDRDAVDRLTDSMWTDE